MSNENSIRNVIKEYLEAEDWKYKDNESGLFVARVTGKKNCNYRMYWYAVEEKTEDSYDQLVIVGVAEKTIPEDKRSDIAEFITRANYDLKLGNFQLDFRDGEFRFRVSLPTKHLTLSKDTLGYLTLLCVQTLEDYIDGVLKVCGGVKPEDAIDEIVKSFGA